MIRRKASPRHQERESRASGWQSATSSVGRSSTSCITCTLHCDFAQASASHHFFVGLAIRSASARREGRPQSVLLAKNWMRAGPILASAGLADPASPRQEDGKKTKVVAARLLPVAAQITTQRMAELARKSGSRVVSLRLCAKSQDSSRGKPKPKPSI